MPATDSQRKILSSLKIRTKCHLKFRNLIVEDKSYKTHIEEEREKAEMTRVIAQIITRLVSVSEHNNSTNPSPLVICFDAPGEKAPVISVKKYMDRIVKYASCPMQCYPVALYYLDQLLVRMPCLQINSMNVQRLLITSITIAAKMFDDNFYSNKYYSTIGGLSVSELNSLEMAFLFGLEFDLSISHPSYLSYFSELRKCCLINKQITVLEGAVSRVGMLIKSEKNRLTRRSSMPGVEVQEFQKFNLQFKRSGSHDILPGRSTSKFYEFRRRSFSLSADSVESSENLLFC